MSELEREKNVLQQLVKAREAVKRKYNLLKFERDEVEKTLGDTFKPIIDPLEKIISQNEQKTTPQDEKAIIPESKSHRYTSLLKISRKRKGRKKRKRSVERSPLPAAAADNIIALPSNLRENLHDASNIETANNSHTKKRQKLSSEEKSDAGDKLYGIRQEISGAYKLGNSRIIFEDDKIVVKGVKYVGTPGLLQLLCKRYPDSSLYNAEDLQTYREILEATSAHRKRHNPNESLKTSNSKKFQEIIGPMFNVKKITGSGLLPKYKYSRPGMRMDYVYWDDPNELVDRLRLLIAERSAGNLNHENEIHSIIEELREAGYILN